MTNAGVARVFLRIAEIMSYREESTFKVRAYYRAALILSALDEPLAEVAARGELETLPGIGEAIAGKIGEILQTGTCALYERLQTEVPESVRLLEQEFDVQSVEAFRALAASGGLADLEGTTVKVEDAAQMLRAAEELGVFEAMREDGTDDG